MNRESVKSVRAAFDRYVAGFKSADRTTEAMLRLKYDHSVRVAVDSRHIAAELGWTPEDTCTAEAAGLLHDIGRFPQFKRHRTFLDSQSVDHGDCGYEALLDSDVLPACDPPARQAILDAVRFHNKRTCPPGLPVDSVQILNLVRDADKVDIYHVVNETVMKKKYEEFPEILLNIDIDGPVSRDLVREILQDRTASYENVKSLADMGLIRIAWVYNINFLPSLRRIVERRLLDSIRGTIPADDLECRAILRDVDRYISDSLNRGVQVLT